MPAQLRNGVKGAQGGKRQGAGRTPDWLKEKCKSLLDKKRLIDFVGDVAAGEPVQAYFGSKDADGRQHKTEATVSADVKERLRAVEMLKEWGFGKSSQPIEHSGDIGSKLFIIRADTK